jgi:hypothetical protein
MKSTTLSAAMIAWALGLREEYNTLVTYTPTPAEKNKKIMPPFS